MIGLLLDNSTGSIRIECILYQNRNVFMAYRINGRRINHLSSEVTQLHCFHITQFGNRICSTDDTGVGSHKTIHIGPYLQNIRIQSRSQNRSCIIRTSTSQIGHFSGILICRNKTGYQCYLGNFLESLSYQTIRQFRVEYMFVMLLFGFDKST